LLDLSGSIAVLQNQAGHHQLKVRSTGGAGPGDWVEWTDGALKTLTPNRAPGRTLQWANRVLDPRRLKAIGIREKVEAAIREFFHSRDFRETRTPLLVPCPGMEPHIRPFSLARRGSGEGGHSLFLPTSPEFAMKRLLAGGLERIFQLCPAFRDEPNSVTHHPEFTILEWYRAFASYENIMRDTEELFEAVARKLNGKPSLVFQGREISVAAPWPRLTVRSLFEAHAGVDLVRSATREALARDCERLGLRPSESESWDDLYFKIWLNAIEPKLPADRAVFVTRYPASQAALSVIEQDADGSRWARRFEAYAGGLELANAFEELTDPVEQRARFEKDMRLREEAYGPSFPANPLDEGFLGALEEGLPPSGGIALGVDRMVMLFADEPDLNYTVWLGSGELNL
jgi:lysyl-tRNA synthetase class 2